MPCSACKRNKPIVARDFCNACYQRWRKKGTTDLEPKIVRGTCQISGCVELTAARGLCDKHYRRLRRHGHTEETRPDSWGAKHKHPLYHSWAWMCRHRAIQPVCKEWLGDFLQFVVDVGEKPSSKHKLFVSDSGRPLGPGNFVWKKAITQKADGEDEKTYRARAQRVYRAVRKEEFRGYDMKKLYGISYKAYENMSAATGGKCYICGKAETTAIRGKMIGLSVDHCHDTGEIRGLLCRKCNQGIGHFNHDPHLLRAAALYLKVK